tara:strand:+ start:550 stop:1539 length:990 start_codon:yes stop_codon:yes gene_type:complete
MITKALVMVALLTIGVTFAYAETSTVEVPFDSHGQSCWYDEISIEYHCTWQGVIEKFTIEDLKQYKDILSNEVYDQEIERLNNEALAEIALEKAKLSPNELKIQQIEDKLDRGIATASESVLMNLLKNLETCQQGMDDRTDAIQSEREFEISEFNLWQVNNVKYDGALGKIVMAIEECRAQQVVYELSVGYENMLTGEDDYQFSLQDKFTSDIQAIPFDQYKRTTLEIDRSAICDNNQFADTQKAQFGCEVTYDGKTVAEIKRENDIRFGTDGMIGYQSESLDNYYDFLETYGNKYATVEDKKAQELISEPIARDMIESNTFYQNHLEE